MSALSIGSLTLNPTFASDVLSYTVSTTNATNTISATATDPKATIEITNGETPVENGSAATWASGANTVKVKVTNGAQSTTYTVEVTKTE